MKKKIRKDKIECEHEWKYVHQFHHIDSTCTVNKSFYYCVICGIKSK